MSDNAALEVIQSVSVQLTQLPSLSPVARMREGPRLLPHQGQLEGCCSLLFRLNANYARARRPNYFKCGVTPIAPINTAQLRLRR